MRLRLHCCAAAAVAVLLGPAAPADAGVLVVDPRSGPWQYAAGGLNSDYQFGLNDHAAPTVVTAAGGYDFTPGGVFTLAAAGATHNKNGAAEVGAAGDAAEVTDDLPGNVHGFFPSRYVDRSAYPVYVNALIGTFADDRGAIVGTPFVIGTGRAVVVPVGATRLQFGLNDNLFADNGGRLAVEVTGPESTVGPAAAVPEPASLALLGLGGLGLAAARRRLARA